jgi:hypothetical protein
MYDEATQELTRFLSLPTATWKPERARAMRYLYNITGDVAWLWKAVWECPDRREGWVELAKYALENSDWRLCFYASGKALDLVEQPMEYLNEEFAWGDMPHDLHAVSSYYLGLKDLALKHGLLALELNPNNARLQENLKYYRR